METTRLRGPTFRVNIIVDICIPGREIASRREVQHDGDRPDFANLGLEVSNAILQGMIECVNKMERTPSPTAKGAP